MRYFPFVLCLFGLGFSACSPKISPAQSGPVLVWADEFDGTGLPDPEKWNYDLGGHGWGNNELQHYTNRERNARQENGHLIIEAHREEYENRQYTSARLITRERASWNRGRVAVRAKLPSGVGTWPAIWMLGTDIRKVGWPTCGEIDIMEHVGYEPDTIYGTVHTRAYNHSIGTHLSDNIYLPDAESAFHTYSVDWHDDRLEFALDGEVYFTFRKQAGATRAEWPFDQPHYLLLNLAVGGNWGGSRGVDENIWPQRMEVDWVRVYDMGK
ncbi:family 16 glycosylhydrolase [Lewinella sp. W8]|nr:family 16 glycosylhydrolase [Lewinella sp. W8]